MARPCSIGAKPALDRRPRMLMSRYVRKRNDVDRNNWKPAKATQNVIALPWKTRREHLRQITKKFRIISSLWITTTNNSRWINDWTGEIRRRRRQTAYSSRRMTGELRRRRRRRTTSRRRESQTKSSKPTRHDTTRRTTSRRREIKWYCTILERAIKAQLETEEDGEDANEPGNQPTDNAIRRSYRVCPTTKERGERKTYIYPKQEVTSDLSHPQEDRYPQKDTFEWRLY